jgi:hypothetical protein
MATDKHFLETIPTWIYFLIIVGAMCYIQIYPLGLPVPITQLSRDTYAAVDALNEGDIILMDQGYGAGTIASHEPGFVAVFKHAMKKGAKVVMVSTSVEAPLLFEQALRKINPESKGYVYGEDYIHFGYLSGGEAAYSAVLEDFTQTYTADYQDTPLSQLPITEELGRPTWQNIDLVYIMSAGGDVCEGWIRQSAVRFDIPMIQQPLEMMVPTILPYYPVNCQGILNGGIGAAEYEVISGFPGDAVKLSDMLSMGGLVVLIFLIVGNIGFYMKPKGGT